MKNIVGYINIFKNKTGFCIPVFDIEGNLLVQDGEQLMEPHSNMLIENQTFFKLKEAIHIQLDFKKDMISLFMYNEGNKYKLIQKSTPFTVFEIPRDELDKCELKELNSVINSLEKNPDIISYTDQLKSKQLSTNRVNSLFKGVFENFSFQENEHLVENLYHLSFINSKRHLTHLINVDTNMKRENMIVERALSSLDRMKNKELINMQREVARVYSVMEDSLKARELTDFQKGKIRGFVNRNKKNIKSAPYNTNQIMTTGKSILNLASQDKDDLWEAHIAFNKSKKTKNKEVYDG
ncbi:hypothetical protein [Pseudotenacibaculum haliotis]|uniref:Uncharacterized protein n=1 Tax=Pseudotenacibaculum haliotis TaxID=1862138 RepID=A0ABW5LU63_9FLAO